MDYPKDWGKVACYDWCENNNKIWLCLENKNAICEIDKKSKNTKILGSFPHNGLGERELSLSVKKSGDYVVFCPFKANDIAVLNVFTEELEFIDLSVFLDTYTGIKKFYRMASYKNYIYFLGIKYSAIMRLDLNTKKVDFFNEWLDEVEKHMCKDAVLFTDGYAQKGAEIYLPIGKCSGILKINLDTMEWKYKEVIPNVCGILGMTQNEELVWFTEYDVNAKKFFQWNLNNNKITQIDLPCQDAFYAPLYYKNSLLFFQNYGKKSYRYEIESEKWEDITNVVPELKNSSDKKVRAEEIDYFSNNRKKFYHWNYKMNMVSHDEFRIEEKDFLNDSWTDYCRRFKKEILIEGSSLSIKDYIEIISRG